MRPVQSGFAALFTVTGSRRADVLHVQQNHHRNWLDALRSRKPTICEVETGHRTATVCHLTNIGYQLRRALQWDAVKEQFAGDAEANALISQPMRSPWTI